MRVRIVTDQAEFCRTVLRRTFNEFTARERARSLQTCLLSMRIRQCMATAVLFTVVHTYKMRLWSTVCVYHLTFKSISAHIGRKYNTHLYHIARNDQHTEKERERETDNDNSEHDNDRSSQLSRSSSLRYKSIKWHFDNLNIISTTIHNLEAREKNTYCDLFKWRRKKMKVSTK